MAQFHFYNQSAQRFCAKLRKAGFLVRFDFVDGDMYSQIEVRDREFFRFVGYFSSPRAAYNHLFGTHY